MELKSFRTYKRRSVTRRSGNKASGVTTGGECIINNSDEFLMTTSSSIFVFEASNIQLENLFELDMGILAFGGYIKPTNTVSIKLEMSYKLSNKIAIMESKKYEGEIKPHTWNGIGMHITQQLEPYMDSRIKKVIVKMTIKGIEGTILNFTSFDLNGIFYQDYLSRDFYKPFTQKTNLHIPHIYYLSTDKDISAYLVSIEGVNEIIKSGEPVVLKSCNRCTRFLPINILSEEDTLAFSLHCKKNAPCQHGLFSAYKIINYNELSRVAKIETIQPHLIDNKVYSYYGHQLECRACKKYYVNHALNHLRYPQQYKEDGLRRRALEVLVNTLLNRNLVHYEFENKTKKEFTDHIWKKFNKRCFKCSKKLKVNEMQLDHTMPLAYLYRLDESATCLCAEHNAKKRDSFPVDFYTTEELEQLSEITGLSMEVLLSRGPNMEVVKLLKEHIGWFFDDFLMGVDFQKERDGRLTSDKVYASLERILIGTDISLIKEYQEIYDKNPSSISLC